MSLERSLNRTSIHCVRTSFPLHFSGLSRWRSIQIYKTNDNKHEKHFCDYETGHNFPPVPGFRFINTVLKYQLLITNHNFAQFRLDKNYNGVGSKSPSCKKASKLLPPSKHSFLILVRALLTVHDGFLLTLHQNLVKWIVGDGMRKTFDPLIFLLNCGR